MRNSTTRHQPLTRIFCVMTACIWAASFPAPAAADDWTMHVTVDNAYDVYIGDAVSTDYYVGGDTTHWLTVETWAAPGRDPADYLYVACASDYSVQQGFLGEFVNTTTSQTILTGSPLWQVFPAGEYLSAIDPTWPDPWPANQLPSQSQVDAAISYATANNLWQSTSSAGSYNDSSGLWGALPLISPSAEWIWHDSGNDPGGGSTPPPFNGFNHDEFLVFRVPEPGSVVLLTMGVIALGRAGKRRLAWRS